MAGGERRPGDAHQAGVRAGLMKKFTGLAVFLCDPLVNV